MSPSGPLLTFGSALPAIYNAKEFVQLVDVCMLRCMTPEWPVRVMEADACEWLLVGLDRNPPTYSLIRAFALAPFRRSPMAMHRAWPLPEGIKSVEVNGYPMAYQESGSGIPLVLVHGSMNDYRCWNFQVPVFAAHFRVIAVSLRHYFPEPWDGQGDDFSILQHADDVAEFTRALNLGPVHLLGHSRGGAVVLNVAARHPGVIRTLILEDASGLEALLPETPESRAMAVEGRRLHERLAADLSNGDRETALRAYVDALSWPGRWEELTSERKSSFFDNVATAIQVEVRPSLSVEAIRKFQFPILMFTGETSPRRYGQMLRAMRDCLPGTVAQPKVIPNAAHGMNRDNPEAFNAAVLEFLSGR